VIVAKPHFSYKYQSTVGKKEGGANFETGKESKRGITKQKPLT